MMLDLGKYQTEVLAAYAVTFALLFALLAVSLIRARKVARELDEAEARRNTPNG